MQGGLGGGGIRQGGQDFHVQLDRGHFRRGDKFHGSVGNPGSANGKAGAFGVKQGFGGDTMPDGVSVNVAIMQVSNPFVPVVMRIAPAQVGLRQEGTGTGDGDFRLKDVMFIAALGLWGVAAFVAQENRDDAGAWR